MPKSNVDILKILQTKLSNTSAQFLPGQLGLAAIKVDPGVHREVFKTLVEADEYTAVSAITGLDLGANLGVFYHVRTSNAFLTIEAEVPKDKPKIQTVSDIAPSASLHELEVSDLFGVTFEGNPRSGHLVLPETWPEGIFPLRKDVNPNEVKMNPPLPEEKSDDGKLVRIVIGPQHPALLEPEKFAVLVEGETVKAVQPRIGYVHRGIEKASESRSYIQDIFLVERICGICNSCHADTFVGAVEKILKAEVPPRGKYLRTIILEVNRLHSHLLTLGHAGLEIGYETLFQYFWRDREPIMDIMEMLTGNRVISSAMTVGGVRRDLKDTDIPKIRTVLNDLRKRLPFYTQIYRDEPSIRARMQNVGVMKREDALKLGVVGPVARGSGVDIDVRKDEPYEAYGEIPFEVITKDAGDTWARMNVRMDEVEESIKIIEYALDHLPSGAYRVRVPRVVPAGEAVHRVEAPRGELFYYVRSNGTAQPERVKVRTPTFANLPAFLTTAVGEPLADVPPNFVSLDPCFSCTDR